LKPPVCTVQVLTMAGSSATLAIPVQWVSIPELGMAPCVLIAGKALWCYCEINTFSILL
jgi:hypothetical protein